MSHRHRETGDGRVGLPRRYHSLPRSSASGEEITEGKHAKNSSRLLRTSSTSANCSASLTPPSGRRQGSLRSARVNDSSSGEPNSSVRSRNSRRQQRTGLEGEPPGQSKGGHSTVGVASTGRQSGLTRRARDSNPSVGGQAPSGQYQQSRDGGDVTTSPSSRKKTSDRQRSPGVSGGGNAGVESPASRKLEARRRASSESDVASEFPQTQSAGVDRLNCDKKSPLITQEDVGDEEDEGRLVRDDSIKRSARRDISLLSQEITSAYEGSMTRRYSDKRRGKASETTASSAGGKSRASVDAPSMGTKSSEKSTSSMTQQELLGHDGGAKSEEMPGGGAVQTGHEHIKRGPQSKRSSHRRSRSEGSHLFVKTEDLPTEKPQKKGFFSSRKLSDSEVGETLPSKRSKWGMFSLRRFSSGSSRDSSDSEEKSSSIFRRKYSGPEALTEAVASSIEGKRSNRKFSVPSKFFPSKDSNFKADSTCSSPEAPREQRRRRISLPGRSGTARTSSLERNLDAERNLSSESASLEQRRRQFKKAATFDCDSDGAKASALQRLRFWDRRERDSGKSPERKSSTESAPKQSLHFGRRKKSKDEDSSGPRTETPATTKLQNSEVIPHEEAKEFSSSAQRNKVLESDILEAKARYVGSVEASGSPPLRSHRKGRYKVTGEEATVRKTQASGEAMAGEAGDKPDGSQTSSALARLRERRRRRRMVREQSEEEGKKERRASLKKRETNGGDNTPEVGNAGVPGEKSSIPAVQRTASGKLKEKSKSTEGSVPSDSKVSENVVDGKLPSRTESNHKNGLVKNGHVIPERKESKDSEIKKPPPKADRESRRDHVGKPSLRDARFRHQTIASTGHSDIIANLLKSQARTSREPEVLFPSVSDLRAKFLAQEDAVPLRLKKSMTEDRPRSICGETLSPNEMKEFDIQFSLERKISTEIIAVAPERNEAIVVRMVETEMVEEISMSLQPSGLPGGEIDDAVFVEPSVETGRPPVSPGTDKKSRGSKKKRKRSLFGSDKDHGKSSKDHTGDGEAAEGAQPAKASGLKAMFGRRASMTISRPKALAAGLKSELVRKATEMTQRRETYDQRVRMEVQANQMAAAETGAVRGEDAQRDRKDSAKEGQARDGDEKKEKKSLKKASKTRKEKRIFKSSLRPFGLSKTKSESNLYQPRHGPVSVDIPLDDDKSTRPVPKSKNLNGSSESIQVSCPAESNGDAPTLLEEGLKEFFGDSKGQSSTGVQPEITLDDLDLISGQSTQQLSGLAASKLRIKPRRSHAGSANPLKSLQSRKDVRTDIAQKPKAEEKQTTEEKSGEKARTPLSNESAVVRRRRKSKDPANLWRRHTMVDLSASALAGLASTEDFTKIRLRKTAGPEEKENSEYDGTKPLMLLHIKGRRSIQTRLIEPSKTALNSGDCFVLVTPTDCFAWIGKEANTVERAKVTEISSRVVAKHELKCKAKEVVFIEEKDPTCSNSKFWKILNAEKDAEVRGPDSLPRDEEYEKGLIKSNMVYKVHWTEPPHLMPVEEMCGHLPQFSILHTKEVFVFDFGSELYVWNGQQSLSGKRKTVLALAKQLYESPFKANGLYDSVYPYGKTAADTENASGRPAWTLFAQLHEKAETILFREKFLDWPDPTKIIKMKGHISSGEMLPPPPPVELKPCDPRVFQQPVPRLADQVLEGANVGRGLGVPTVWVGDHYKEGNMVTTVKRTVWHINEFRHFELPPASIGHFYSGEGYVIRWEYFVLNDRVATDRRSRCRSTVAGRVRTAYFFWQGNDCSVNEKGAAAVMAVELDEEKGPQIRVVQEKEPPSFLNLFKGAMIIHRGKREHQGETTEKIQNAATIRLYVVRNEQPGESCLVQVTANSFSLRSQGSFVLLLCNEAHIYIWHGSKSSEDLRSGAKMAAKAIQDRKPIECNVAQVAAITGTELEEGGEPDEFWEALGSKKYHCSLDPQLNKFAPRLYQLSSTTGTFAASEVLCPSRSENKICTFPFLQEDLYGAYQPALYLLDGHSEVYVWEGWRPKDDTTGSGKQRWDKDRQLAMETALSYAQTAEERIGKRVFVVYAGLEPASFKAFFSCWNDRPDVTKHQKEEGKQTVDRFSVKELLLRFTKEFYTLEELKRNPQGVDPAKLETYLSEEEFQMHFGMTKEELHQLPGWKQVNLKKRIGLF